MVEFLGTKQTAAQLEQIIEVAKQELFLVSPYIKADQQIRERLATQANSNSEIRITVIYGGKNPRLKPEVWDWLKGLPSVEILYRRHLHAKCYLNEQVALVTSMNLYDYSEINNDEMGLRVSAKDDRDLYGKIREDVRRIAANSEVRKAATVKPAPASKAPTAPKPAPSKPAPASGIPFDYSSGITRPAPKPAPSKPAATSGIPKVGFCIRDKASIPANPIKPYCDRCYRSWNRYKDPEYEEKYCHICGKESDSTMVKPLCLPCYRRHKDDFEFAI